MLVILDTSTLISYLISRAKSYSRDIIRLAKFKKLTLVISKETLQELKKKLHTSKIKQAPNYNSRAVGIFIAWYQYNARLFVASVKLAYKIRDQKDYIFLQLVSASHANYIITLDRDLLAFNKIGKTKIVTPETFINQEFPE